MLLLIKLILMVTPVKNSLIKHLTNFIVFFICLYGSRISFMIELNVKQINISLLSPKIFLLLYLFLKTPLILITEYQWILKAPFLLLLKKNSYIFVINDAFSHCVVTNPAPHITSKYAFQTLLHHWITKFGPPQNLVTDRGTEYINEDMAHLCSLFDSSHSPRTAYSPWTNGLVEFQNRNLGTHLRFFFTKLSYQLVISNLNVCLRPYYYSSFST